MHVNRTEGTNRPGIGVTASDVLMTPWMIQGCLPSSVTIQPTSTATRPRAVDQNMAFKNQRDSNNRPRHHSVPAHRARHASHVPMATMI